MNSELIKAFLNKSRLNRKPFEPNELIHVRKPNLSNELIQIRKPNLFSESLNIRVYQWE